MTSITPLSDGMFAALSSLQKDNFIERGAESDAIVTNLLAVIADELHVLNEQINELSCLAFARLDNEE